MGILEGKAVVITGAGRGIGAACAKGCARQGAAVVVNDIYDARVSETVDAIRGEGGKAVPGVADITKWEDAGRLIETCITAFGKIDGLVNNAALIHSGRIDEFDPKAAQSVVDVNVIGALYCTARAVKPMLAQGSGSIVNVVSGAHMGMRTLGIYGATKGAVASMIYTWALELAGSGVRVNGLSPLGATLLGLPDDSTPEDVAAYHKDTQKPEANSPVVEFFLSDLAKTVNGQILRIDRSELSLYIHPALLLPAAEFSEWTAEAIADVFNNDFKDRQIPCGVMGMTTLPVQLQSGIWKRMERSNDAPGQAKGTPS